MRAQVRSGALIALMLFGGLQAAVAKQCSTELPSHAQRHWSYRLIDGRKCWYEGDNNFPKSLLQWPEQRSALSAFGKAEPSPKEAPSLPAAQPASSPPQPAIQSDPESFEARWRALHIH